VPTSDNASAPKMIGTKRKAEAAGVGRQCPSGSVAAPLDVA
jgi:hypothetical protein